MHKLVNGEKIPLTLEEITSRQAEEVKYLAEQPRLEKLAKRQAALTAKWPDAFAMLDDMLKENPAAFPKTRADRDAIKAANPKE